MTTTGLRCTVALCFLGGAACAGAELAPIEHASTSSSALTTTRHIDAACAAIALDAIDEFRAETQAAIDALETQFTQLAQAWLDSHPAPKLPAAQEGALSSPQAWDQMRGEAAQAEAYTEYLDTDPVIEQIRLDMERHLERANTSSIFLNTYLWAMDRGDLEAAECVAILRDTPAAMTILDDSCYASPEEALDAQAAIVAAQDAALTAPGLPDLPAFVGEPDDPEFEKEKPAKCVKPMGGQPAAGTDPAKCPAPQIEIASPADDEIKVGCKAVIVMGSPATGTNKSVVLPPTPESGVGTSVADFCPPKPAGKLENDFKRATDSLMKYSWSSESLGFTYSSHAGTYDKAMNLQQDKGVKELMESCVGIWPDEPAAKGKLGGGLKVKPYILYVPKQSFDPRRGKWVPNDANLPAALTERGKIVGAACDPYVMAFSNFSMNEEISIEAKSQMFTIPSRRNPEKNTKFAADTSATLTCWSTGNTGGADDPGLLSADTKVHVELNADCRVDSSESTTASAEISANAGAQAGGKDGPMRLAGFGATAGISKTNTKAYSCTVKTWEADSWESAVKTGEEHSTMSRATTSCRATHPVPMRQIDKIANAGTHDVKVNIPTPQGGTKELTVKVVKPMSFFGSSTLMNGFQLEGITTKAATTFGNVSDRSWVGPIPGFDTGSAFSYSYAGLAVLYHRPFVKNPQTPDKPDQKSQMSVVGVNCEVLHFQYNSFEKSWKRVETGVPIATPPGGDDDAKKKFPMAIPTGCEIATPAKREYWMFKPVKEALKEQIPDVKF